MSCKYSQCSALTSVTIGNSVTTIGDCTFQGCSGLTSVTIQDNVTSIGNSSFAGCSGLTSLTIPNSVTSIGNYSFSNCTGLTSLTIGSSVTSIGWSAFYNCSGLTSVTIPSSVTSIGSQAFLGCNGLTSVTIGNSVTYIGERAFLGCTKVTSLTIPNNVTSIGSEAFLGCSGLTSVTFEDGNEILLFSSYHSVTPFDSCPIKSLNLGRNISYDSTSPFQNQTSLVTLTISNRVKTISSDAFLNCSNLTDISIGESIKEIGNKSFANCQKLENVWCYAVRYPNTAADAFEGSYIDYAILHVPAEGVEPYRKQAPWSGFRKIIPIEAPDPSDITLSDAGYSTYYDKYFDTVLPAGVKASVVTSASNSRLTYQVIADGNSGGIVPAGTAVLLQGKQRSSDTYTLTPKENTTSYTGPNLLHGSDDPTTTTADGNCLFYKLAYGPSGTALSNTLGWFWGANNGRPFDIEGHKAWLAIPQTSASKPRALFYSIEGDAIDIEGLPLIPSQGEDTPSSEWYDLQGRRVENPTQRGIYIRDGKKVMVK